MVERTADQNVRINCQTKDTSTVTAFERLLSIYFSIFFRTVEQIFVVVVAVDYFAPDLNVAAVKPA